MEIGWRVPSYARKWTKSAESRELVKYFASLEFKVTGFSIITDFLF